jgi:hypothetical protein
MYSPMVASDVMAAKATVEPSMGRPSRKAASTITQVEATGVEDRSLTRASHLQMSSDVEKKEEQQQQHEYNSASSKLTAA